MKNPLDELSPRERKALTMRYGVDGPPMSQQAIAKEWHLSAGRIGQLQRRALRKLRLPRRWAKADQLPPAIREAVEAGFTEDELKRETVAAMRGETYPPEV